MNDREQEVRSRPGEDDEHLLPGPLAPVRIAAEPVLQLVEAALGRFPRTAADLGLLERLLELGQERARTFHVALLEAALDALERREQLGGLVHCGAEERLQVRRRRPVHPRNLHVAPEWDGSDSVLDPVALRLDERRREADVETARAHAHCAGGVEVAGLVHEDEQAEPEDRDEDVHVTRAPDRALGHAAGLGIGVDERVQIARRGAVDGSQRLLDDSRDAQERKPSGEECRHCDLVRRVVGTGVGPAGLARAACECEERERLEVGRLEFEREAVGKVEWLDRGCSALRIGQCERDRHAHVRIAKVRERSAVAEARDRVHDRGRVDDDLDLLVRQAEEKVRLDQLEALVGERRGVDRDLRAHPPRRVRKRVGSRDVGELLARPAAERPTRCGQDDRVHSLGGASLEALEERRVLTVDGE